MKKIVITLITLLPIVAYGDNMCVKDGSVLVVLDPLIGGTGLEYSDRNWSVQFSYGVVSGISGRGTPRSNVGTLASDQVAPNNPLFGAGYCYCKMLRPVESLWVSSGAATYGISLPDCANNCKSSVASNATMRISMFGNIAE